MPHWSVSTFLPRGLWKYGLALAVVACMALFPLWNEGTALQSSPAMGLPTTSEPGREGTLVAKTLAAYQTPVGSSQAALVCVAPKSASACDCAAPTVASDVARKRVLEFRDVFMRGGAVRSTFPPSADAAKTPFVTRDGFTNATYMRTFGLIAQPFMLFADFVDFHEVKHTDGAWSFVLDGVRRCLNPYAHLAAYTSCALSHPVCNTNVEESTPDKQTYLKSRGKRRLSRDGATMNPRFTELNKWVVSEVTGLVVTAFNVIVTEVGFGISDVLLHNSSTADTTNRTRLRGMMCMTPDSWLTEVPPSNEEEEIIVLAQNWGHAVYHFFAENFSKAVILQGYLRRHATVKVHVQKDPMGFPYIMEGLRLLGIPLDRVVYGTVRARIAHFPEGQGCGGTFQSTPLVMRERLRAISGVPPAVDIWGVGPTQHVVNRPLFALHSMHQYYARFFPCVNEAYIAATGEAHPMLEAHQQFTRGVAGSNPPMHIRPQLILVKRTGKTRRVINHEELKHALTRLPVDVFEFQEGLPLNETFKHYALADIIVAPHGAAQINNVLAAPGTHFVELITYSSPNLMYHSFSCQLGHNYTFFMPNNSSQNGGFNVDVERVVAHIASIFSN